LVDPCQPRAGQTGADYANEALSLRLGIPHLHSRLFPSSIFFKQFFVPGPPHLNSAILSMIPPPRPNLGFDSFRPEERGAKKTPRMSTLLVTAAQATQQGHPVNRQSSPGPSLSRRDSKKVSPLRHLLPKALPVTSD